MWRFVMVLSMGLMMPVCVMGCRTGFYPDSDGTCILCNEDYYCPGWYLNRYRGVEYIQNDTCAYIDTGAVPTAGTTIDGVFNLTGYGTNILASQGWFPFFGVKSVGRYAAFINKNTGVLDFDYFDYNEKDSFPDNGLDKTDIRNQKFKISTRISNNTFSLLYNDILIHSVPVKQPNSQFQPLGINIFKMANDTRCASGKVYSFSIYEYGILVRDMVPVFDTITSQYGMFDRVSETFYGSIGTDSFIGGDFLPDKISCADATAGIAPRSPIGSDEVSDCGHILHIGDNKKLYLRSQRRTSPSFNVMIGDNIFYGDIGPGKHGWLRMEYHGQTMSIYNMDVDD